MVEPKRFIRHGLVISGLGHAGLLATGLFFVWASPHEAVPPEAMLVELITPKDMPRLSGTPSPLPTSGTERAAQSQTGTTKTAMSEPKPPVPPREQKEQRAAAAKPRERQTAQPQTKEPPPMPQAPAAEVAMVQSPPDPPAATADETPDELNSAATLAQLALLGGRLGGGFAAPPIDSPLVGYDFTAEFRERVSSCAVLPPGIDPNEPIRITLRVFLNRDGTLAARPQLREANPSAKQQALMQSFVSGLEKCQPYAMLPQDRYKQWKMLDLVVYPLNAFGG
jgi:hypothetical protein